MRRAAHRERLDQLQRPLLPGSPRFRNFRSRSRVRLPDFRRLPRLGAPWPATLCTLRNPDLSPDTFRRPDLRMGQARPRMAEKGPRMRTEDLLCPCSTNFLTTY